MIKRAPAPLLAILASALVGCGTGTLTATQLRRQATLVCAAAVRRSDRIPLPRSNAGGAAFLAKGLTVFEPELTALRKLVPPRRLTQAYRAALGDAKQQLDALIATDHNLNHGDDAVVAIKQLEVELEAINARDRGAWRAVGAPQCANLPASGSARRA